jgi:hypothetical protein
MAESVERGTALVADRRIERLRAFARVLDSAFVLPGTRFRFGVDAIIGLVPGLGDAVGAVFSAYIVLQAIRLGASRATLLRMVWNVAVETVVGVVPILGDLFDAGYKANLRNVRLLDLHVSEPERARSSSRRFVVLLVLAVLLVVAGIAAAAILFAVALSAAIRRYF